MAWYTVYGMAVQWNCLGWLMRCSMTDADRRRFSSSVIHSRSLSDPYFAADKIEPFHV